MTTESLSAPITTGRIARATVIAALGAAAANAVLYLLGAAAGIFPSNIVIPASGQPLSLGPVIFMSVVGAVGAGLVFAVINRFSAQPVRVFHIVALVALVLSFGTPFAFPNAPLSFYLGLDVMHIVAAAIITWTLTTQTKQN